MPPKKDMDYGGYADGPLTPSDASEEEQVCQDPLVDKLGDNAIVQAVRDADSVRQTVVTRHPYRCGRHVRGSRKPAPGHVGATARRWRKPKHEARCGHGFR